MPISLLGVQWRLLWVAAGGRVVASSMKAESVNEGVIRSGDVETPIFTVRRASKGYVRSQPARNGGGGDRRRTMAGRRSIGADDDHEHEISGM